MATSQSVYLSSGRVSNEYARRVTGGRCGCRIPEGGVMPSGGGVDTYQLCVLSRGGCGVVKDA